MWLIFGFIQCFEVAFQAIFIRIQHFTGLAAFKRANNTSGFQLVDNTARTIIAQFHFALDE